MIPTHRHQLVALAGALAIGAAGLVASIPATAGAISPPPTIVSAPGTVTPVVLGPAPATRTVVDAPARTPDPTLHSSSGATFVVNYDAGFDANPAAKAAFQFAVDQWSQLISSSVPIEIDASFGDLGDPSILGGAGPAAFYRDFPGAPRASTWYPAALANSLGGSDLNGTASEIVAQFSSTFPSFYFGTDGNTGGKVDFASVVMHELGHGLGFLGAMNVSGGNGTCCLSGFPTVFDRFTTSNGTALLSIPDGSGAGTLGPALQGHDVRFTGTQAVAAAGGTAPKLYDPVSWEPGSSYSHLDDATYPAGDPNSLMTHAIGPNEVVHDPGPITLGIFADSGWTVTAYPVVSIGNARVVEGRSGSRNPKFTVSLSAPVAWNVSVHYATSDSTAVAPGDYTAKSGTAVIPAGSTSTTIAVAVRGDAVVEPVEKFRVRISSPTGARLGTATGTGTINNDDPGSGIQVSVGDASVTEGNSGNRKVTVVVSLSTARSTTATVHWATGTGSATSGVDYTPASGTVTFPAGTITTSVSFTVKPDTTHEGAETVPVVLSSASGATIIRATGTATITDDD
ncbi:MAG: Calx-beta domain-containing protein [Acidimicrobiia bacterium]